MLRIKLALLLGVLAILGCTESGVRVVVSNVGSETMHDTIVIFTGARYPLGTIASGNSVEAVVRSTGESSVEIQYVDIRGAKRSVPVDCYFEGGYKGCLVVKLDNGTVAEIDNQIRI